MIREEAEQLAECIRTDAGKQIAVLGIEPFGAAINSSYQADFFVKCACRTTGLQFVVKSFEHWKDINQQASHFSSQFSRWVVQLPANRHEEPMS